MKKLFLCMLTAGLLLSSAGCASSGGGSSGDIPQFVNDAYNNASEDVIVGIGSYRIGNSPIDKGRSIAENRARAAISRQLDTIVKTMIEDYTAGSELDPSAELSFQQEITQTLSKSRLKGAKIVKSQTHNGTLWVVVEYDKSAAAEAIDQAANAAKLKVPQAATFKAVDRMDAAFEKEAGSGPVMVDEG